MLGCVPDLFLSLTLSVFILPTIFVLLYNLCLCEKFGVRKGKKKVDTARVMCFEEIRLYFDLCAQLF
jgi:hypothetical protein